jgi:hypothetical protein
VVIYPLVMAWFGVLLYNEWNALFFVWVCGVDGLGWSETCRE